jgi:polysaccharide export outer membrane protein
MLRVILLSALLPFALLMAPEPARGGSPASIRNETKTGAADEYRIGAEDVLEIHVWNNTVLSRTVPVRPDGKISLPLVRDVGAAGSTAMQLGNVLTRRLATYMSAPEVSVIVREVHSFKVSVLGEVKKPGRYELRSGATVLDAIAMAEGLNDFASRGGIVVLRHDGPTVKRIPFSYKKIVSGHSEEENFYLRRGDIILVP